MRRYLLVLASAVATACGSSDSVAPPASRPAPSLPAARPPDLRITGWYRHGSGMQPRRSYRLGDQRLVVTEGLEPDAFETVALTPTDLDAIYAAVREVAAQPPREPPLVASEQPAAALTIEAAGTRLELDTRRERMSMPDHALFDALDQARAAGRRAPRALPPVRPADLAVTVATTSADRIRGEAVTVSAAGVVVTTTVRGDRVETRAPVEPHELDDLYPRVRQVAERGLAFASDAPHTWSTWITIDTGGQPFQVAGDPATLPAADRAALDALVAALERLAAGAR